jgi:cation diffusion facilitator family transporter
VAREGRGLRHARFRLGDCDDGPGPPLVPTRSGGALASRNVRTRPARVGGPTPGSAPSAGGDSERKTLRLLLAINAAMFVVELVVGWLAQSMGLIADSLDMFADAGIYTAALLAIGSGTRCKTHAAAASGILQLVLGAAAAIEAVRRAVVGSEPVSVLMIAIASLALGANASCVWLLREHRRGEIHMRASWIFSTTDVKVNIGVIVAGVLVVWTGSRWPDLVVGLIVCGMVVRGGARILREALKSYGELGPRPSTHVRRMDT